MDVAHFSRILKVGHISDAKESRSDLLICEARKGPEAYGIDFMGIIDVSHVF